MRELVGMIPGFTVRFRSTGSGILVRVFFFDQLFSSLKLSLTLFLEPVRATQEGMVKPLFLFVKKKVN